MSQQDQYSRPEPVSQSRAKTVRRRRPEGPRIPRLRMFFGVGGKTISKTIERMLKTDAPATWIFF
jgi:hypothetical protein